jgi:hypothetical protein
MIKAVERKVVVPQLVPSGGRQIAPEVSQLHQAVMQLAEAHNHHDDQLNRALRGGTSAENNARVKYKKLRIAMPSDAPYLPLTLNSGDGWINYGAGFYDAAYLMEPGGRVTNRGLVAGGVPDYGATGRVGTLPIGYAPGHEIGGASEGGNGAYGLWRVNPSGEIFFAFSASGGPYLFLNDLSWIAPNAARPHAFTGGTWPVVIQHGLPDACTGLDVVACRYADGPSGTAGAPVADWEDLGDGRIRLNGLWGLQWGAVYNVTVRLSAEA